MVANQEKCPECKRLVQKGGEVHFGSRYHKACWTKSRERYRSVGAGLTKRQATIRTKKYRKLHKKK